MRSEMTRREYSDHYQSWFSHLYATWACNHRGWQKMKKYNKKLIRKKMKKEAKKEINEYFDSVK